MWTNQDIEDLLTAANSGVDLEELSRTAFFRRFNSDQIRKKIRQLSNKAFDKFEDMDILEKAEFIRNEGEEASKYFKRPVKILKDRLDRLEGTSDRFNFNKKEDDGKEPVSFPKDDESDNQRPYTEREEEEIIRQSTKETPKAPFSRIEMKKEVDFDAKDQEEEEEEAGLIGEKCGKRRRI